VLQNRLNGILTSLYETSENDFIDSMHIQAASLQNDFRELESKYLTNSTKTLKTKEPMLSQEIVRPDVIYSTRKFEIMKRNPHMKTFTRNDEVG
jgi:hypothetical protein